MSEQGLYGKYGVWRADGAPVTGGHFILRPERDPHAATVAAAFPSVMERYRGQFVVKKLERWGGNARSVDDPPWPIYGDPLADAVALPTGPFGDDGRVAWVVESEVSAVLSAYADAVAADNPELATDLRAMLARATP